MMGSLQRTYKRASQKKAQIGSSLEPNGICKERTSLLLFQFLLSCHLPYSTFHFNQESQLDMEKKLTTPSFHQAGDSSAAWP
jgi:hypothetical protein